MMPRMPPPSSVKTETALDIENPPRRALEDIRD
jgi:hypothetical protein